MKAIWIVLAAGVTSILASYVMWRASSHSGLAALIAGAVLALVAFAFAVLIGWLMTQSFVGGL